VASAGTTIDGEPTASDRDDLEAQRLAAVRACGVVPGTSNAAFDGIAQVASKALRAPIALVSIVEETHQWFAARIGLEPDSTGRDVSFCSSAIQHPDELFVVPDALEDPRFRDNALVTGDPFIRFYAGAPIRSPDGFGLGSICVIDTAPRPEGLSENEARILELLARQVEQQLELLHLATALDLTEAELQRGREELDAERGFHSAALGNLTEGIVACDADGHLTYFNAVTREMHGVDADPTLPPEQWSEHYDLYEPDGVTPLPPERIPLMRAIAGEQVHEQEMVIAPRGRESILVSASGQSFHGPDGELLGAVVTMRDVTERRRSEAALRHSAEHDLLTGLPNRSVFSQRLEAALASDDWEHTAVCFIDLNDFKRINDDLGHPVGDQVLAAVAGRLHQAVKESDTVARYGGDEFIVLLEDVTDASLGAIVARMHESLTPPLRIGRHLVDTSAAIGAAHAGADGLRDERALVRLADERMYEDKAR
jgi:diguanylate cyclase (GGDEF)-like protein